MNDFTFRVWDKKYKEMITGVWIAPEYDWLVMSDNDALAERDNRGRAANEKYVIMRCTGLKDKKGRVAYEGDITVRDLDGEKGVVEMDLGCWTMSGDGQLPLHQEQFEIIGNIYQYPKLLGV